MQKQVEDLRITKDELIKSVSFAFVTYEQILKNGSTFSKSFDHFVEVINAFSKELDVKYKIAEDIANTTDRNLLFIYLASWKMECFVSKEWPLLQDLFVFS